MSLGKLTTLILVASLAGQLVPGPQRGNAQTTKHPACPPPPGKGLAPEERQLKQWEHVLLLDNSISMVKPSKIWEPTRKAFASHASRIPLGSRVSFYVFNPRQQEYNPRLAGPSFETDYLDQGGRQKLVDQINKSKPVARVTPLTFYLEDLLRRHANKDNPALGHSFYIYTDGADESCVPKFFPRFKQYLSAHHDIKYSQADCLAMVSGVEAKVRSERKANSYFIWTVTKPEKPCTSDSQCGEGRCITLSNGEKRCVQTPSEEWTVSLSPTRQSHPLNRGAAGVKELLVAEATVKTRADFPALVVTSFKEDGTRVLDFEPPSMILSGKDKVFKIKTRVSILTGVKELPAKVNGSLIFTTCWGRVRGLTSIPLTFTMPREAPPMVKTAQFNKIKKVVPWSKGVKYPNFKHLKRRKMSVMVYLEPAEGGVYAGITSARLEWGSKTSPRRMRCTVENQLKGRLRVSCPPPSSIKQTWRARTPRTYQKARLILKDSTGRFSFEDPKTGWLRTWITVPARVRGAGGSPVWPYLVGLLLLAVIGYFVMGRLSYPPVKGKLFLQRPDSGPVELFTSQYSRFKAPETRLGLSQLFDGAGPGELTLSLDRGGKITLDPQDHPLTWAGKPLEGPRVIGEVNSKGALIRGRANLGLEGHPGLKLLSDTDLAS